MGEDRLLPAAVEAAIAAVPGVGPLFAPFTGPLVKALADEHARRRSVAIKAAERASGMSREDLEEVLAADHRLVDLTISMLYTAGVNGHDETLEMLGTVLGHSATTPDFIEVARDCLEALRSLRDGHLWVLAYANRRAEEAGRTDVDWNDAKADDGRWSASQAAEGAGIQLELVVGYIAGLVGAGLVSNPPVRMYPGASPVDYIITPLGRRVAEMATLRRGPTD